MTIEKALLLIGSPKGKKSASLALSGYLLGRIGRRGVPTDTLFIHPSLSTPEGTEKILAAARDTDLLILAFPLYVDHLPAPVISFLERLSDSLREKPAVRPIKVTAVVQSGFPETHQNQPALDVVRRFCAETGLEWAGGLAMGMGGAVTAKPLEKGGGMLHNVVKAFNLAGDALAEGRSVPDEAVRLMHKKLMPVWFYIFMGNFGMKRMARKGGGLKKAFDQPYLEKN